MEANYPISKNKKERVRMLNMLAAYHYQQAKHNLDDEEGTTRHMDTALSLLKKAKATDPNNPDLHIITNINMALYHFRFEPNCLFRSLMHA